MQLNVVVAALPRATVFGRSPLALAISVLLFITVGVAGTAQAQSTDRVNPTKLTSNEFSGEINSEV